MSTDTPAPLLERITGVVATTILQVTGRCVRPQPRDRLLRPGWLESVEIPRLAMALQEELGVTFDSTDLSERNFESIERIADLVRRRAPRA